MLFIRRDPASAGLRHLAGAVIAAALLVLAIALPAGASEGPTRLSDASVSPRTGTTGTTISLAVTYRNREGSAPAWVRVVIDGKAHAMTGDGGTDWKRGVVHHFATRLTVGKHAVSFSASDTRRFTAQLDGGTVTINAPSPPPPAPKPTPKPNPTLPPPAPTADPNPHPTPAPIAIAGTDGATGGGTTTGGSDAGGTSGPGLGTTGPGTAEGWASGPLAGDVSDATSGSGESAGNAGGGAPGVGSSEAIGESGGPGGGPNTAVDASGGGFGWGAMTAALAALGLDQGSPWLRLMPTLIGTSGAVVMTFAFAIFGKKRRDGEPPAPDEVLQANAARGTGVAASGQLILGVAGLPLAVDAEAAMPRWRRPSLIEARKADPGRSLAATPRMSFETGRVGAVADHERRVIRYRVVRLLDAPDELRGTDIGQLDQGDEVQLLEKSGAYWLVLCPDGRQGWLHKMTLGEVVGESPAPDASDPWSADVDSDVLQAFIDARARA